MKITRMLFLVICLSVSLSLLAKENNNQSDDKNNQGNFKSLNYIKGSKHKVGGGTVSADAEINRRIKEKNKKAEKDAKKDESDQRSGANGK